MSALDSFYFVIKSIQDIVVFMSCIYGLWLIRFVRFSFIGDQWVGFDDPESIRFKVLLEVVMKDLRGFMMWDIAFDDFDGFFCRRGPYPLLNAANQVLDEYQGVDQRKLDKINDVMPYFMPLEGGILDKILHVIHVVTID